MKSWCSCMVFPLLFVVSSGKPGGVPRLLQSIQDVLREQKVLKELSKDNFIVTTDPGNSSSAVTRGILTPSGIYRYDNLGSLNETILLPNGENIDEWIPPYNLSSRFPSYQAGYDFENRPIWVAPFGKWNIKSIDKEGHIKEYQYYVLQGIHRVIKSAKERSIDEGRAPTIAGLVDFDNFQMDQAFHVPVNYAAQSLYLLVKPVVGSSLIHGTQVFGNKKSLWQPQLFRLFPAKYIPHKYGGSHNFKPVQTLG